MPAIDFDFPEPPKRRLRISRKHLAWSIGVIAAVTALVLGSTYASNITLNSNTPVEFGQGTTVSTACDSAITVKPESSFVNTTGADSGSFTRTVGSWDPYGFEITDISGLFVGQRISSPALGSSNVITAINTSPSVDTNGAYSDFPNPTTVYIVSFSNTAHHYNVPTQETMTFAGGGFYLTSISVSDISSDCYGRPFTIRAYKSGSSTPLDLYVTNGTTYNYLQVLDVGGSFSLQAAGLLSDDIQNITDGFTISLTTTGPPPSEPLALATDVNSITIESGASNLVQNINLNGYSFTTAQVGFIDEFDTLAPGCSFASCTPYYSAKDWLDNVPDSYLGYSLWSSLFGVGSSRSDANSKLSLKFIYNSSANSDNKWSLAVYVNGVIPFEEEFPSGYIVGFNGSSGVWIPSVGSEAGVAFSAGDAMENSSIINEYSPYLGHPLNQVPVRDFESIWTYSETRYEP